MCDTCHAGCCRAYNLIITVHDALLIARDLSLPISEFVSMIPQNESVMKRMGDLHVPVRFSDPGYEDTYFFIGLKRVDSRLTPGSPKCYFLQEWERSQPVAERGAHPGAKIAARCGIYTSRPLMCRTYPSFLHPEGTLGFVSDPAPIKATVPHAMFTLCPEKWTPQAFSPEPDRALHTLVLNKYEIDFQNALIREWNKNLRPLKEFFPYAAQCYANRFRIAPQLVTTPEVAPAEMPAAKAP
jgi:Fe-S-cluster containining protein